IDFFGTGSYVTGAYGKSQDLVAQGPQKFVRYSNYYINPSNPWRSYFGGALMPSGSTKLLVDEPEETATEPAEAQKQTSDSIFAASENVIHLSNTDYNAVGKP